MVMLRLNIICICMLILYQLHCGYLLSDDGEIIVEEFILRLLGGTDLL